MYAKIKKVKNFTYRDLTFDLLYVITDEYGYPVILPIMYAIFLSRFGFIYESRNTTDELAGQRTRWLVEREISDSTIRAYVHNLVRFLNYLEECKKTSKTPGMHSSSSCSEKFVNHYLNNILPKSLQSYHSLTLHQAALNAYFNWLDYMGLAHRLNLKILRTTRQQMAAKNNKPHYIQFITNSQRFRLLNICETLCEKLILRMGYEVGLRTSEVAALRLNGKGKLIELFKALDDPQCNHQLSYTLEGKYTKGGKSRQIYFDLELLRDMKRYFKTERRWVLNRTKKMTDCFFLRTDHRFAGTGVGSEHASRVFRKCANKISLNPSLSFHCLRHTFATELFHEEILRNSVRDTRSESGALIVVAQRLGHAFTKNGQAPATTTRYIRMRFQMLEVENMRPLSEFN